jgi:hypothetical protein
LIRRRECKIDVGVVEDFEEGTCFDKTKMRFV